MNNTIEYKGYIGSVEFSEEDVKISNDQMYVVSGVRKNHVRRA